VIDWVILALSVRKIRQRKWTLPTGDGEDEQGLLRNVSQSSRRTLTKEASFDTGTTVPVPEALSYQAPYAQSPGFAYDANDRHED